MRANSRCGHACFIVPAYEPTTVEHFAHIPHLLTEIGGRRPIGVVTEKGRVPLHSSWLYSETIGAQDLSKVGRVRSSVGAVLRAYRRGARLFILRYSRLMIVVLWLMRLLLPIRIAYWTSGQQSVQFDHRPLARLRKRWSDRVTRVLYRLPDFILTGPSSMAAYMAKTWNIPQAKIRVLRNDVDCGRFYPAEVELSSSRRRHVLFVHRLSPRRGTRHLPLICDYLADAGISGTMIVVGDGPDRSFLEAARALSSGTFRMQVYGAVENSRLPDIYRAADVFVMPSYEEGFPRVILEAMASGTPVVAMRAGGTEEIVPPNYEFLVDVGDWRTMARHVEKLLTSDGAAEVGHGLRAWAVENFDTKQVAEDYVSLIDAVLASVVAR